MKRFSALLLLGLFAISCNKGTESTRDIELVEWTFDAPATKASLDGSGAFSWKAGDRIAIWNDTDDAFIPFTTASGSGRFSAKAPVNAHFTTSAFSPSGIAVSTSSVSLPSSYTLAELEHGAGIPMYAPVTDGNAVLHFRHLCAFLALDIRSSVPVIDRVSISAPSLSLSGAFTLADASGDKEVRAVSGSGTISIDAAGAAGPGLLLTIPVPVGTYSLTYTAGNEGDPDMMSFSTVEVSFERAHLYKLSPVSYNSGSFASVIESIDLENDNSNWE